MLIRGEPPALCAFPHDCGMPGIRFLPYGLLSLSRRGPGLIVSEAWIRQSCPEETCLDLTYRSWPFSTRTVADADLIPSL